MELKKIVNVIRSRLWIVILLLIIAICGSLVKNLFLVTPLYQAKAQLIVNQPLIAEGQSTLTTNTVQTQIMLINTYKEILRSAAILNVVVDKYPELNLNARTLSTMLSVSAANGSQVMNIYYIDDSYSKAATIVNAIATAFKEQIPVIMKVDNVTVLNEALPSDKSSPINTKPVFDILVSIFVALIMGLGIVFLLEYLDNTIKSESELEEILGIPSLSVIPSIRQKDLSYRGTNKHKMEGGRTYASLNQ